MIVKVRSDLYINTNQIVSVELNSIKTDEAVIFLTNNSFWKIAPAAAEYLLDLLEANRALILENKEKQPTESVKDYPSEWQPGTFQALKSQLAVILRDTLIQGATIDELMPLTADQTYSRVYEALQALVAERVIIYDIIPGVYYHATHRPNKPAVTPEVDLDLPPRVGSDRFKNTITNEFTKMLANGAFECVECKHQSCPACAEREACCACNCLSFTGYTPAPAPQRESITDNTYIENDCPVCDLPLKGIDNGELFTCPSCKVQFNPRWNYKQKTPNLTQATSAEAIAFHEAEREQAPAAKQQSSPYPYAPTVAVPIYFWRCPQCHKELGVPFDNYYRPGEPFSYGCSCGLQHEVVITTIKPSHDPLIEA